MSTTTHLGRAALLALLTASALTATAHAGEPIVSFDTLGLPSVTTPGESHVLNLRYSVSGSDLENATISIDLPRGVLPTGAGHDPSWVGGCGPDTGSPEQDGRVLDWKCSWTAASINVPQGGISGQIALTLMYPKYIFGVGDVLAATAQLDASYQESGNAVALTPQTSAASTIIDGRADLQWSNSLDISEWSYAYTRLANGTIGVVARIQVTILNNGTTRVDPGATIDLGLPEGVVFAGWSNQGFPLELVSDTEPGDAEIITFGTTDSLGTVGAYPRADSATGGIYARDIWTQTGMWFAVQVLFTCDALPVAPNENVELTLTGVIPGLSPPLASILTSASVPPSYTLTNEQGPFLCGKPVRVGLNRTASSGASQAFGITSALHPPTGVVPVDNSYSCTYIPDGLIPYQQWSYIPKIGFNDAASAQGFRTWTCRLPASTATFDRATFLATHRDSGACETNEDGVTLNEPGRPRVTHVVVEGPEEWGIDDELGRTVWAPVTSQIQVQSATCMANATERDFVIPTFASAEVSGVTQTATNEMPVHSSILANTSWSSYNNPTTATRGQTQKVLISPTLVGDSAPLLNPVITIPLPAGVTPVAVAPPDWGTNVGCTTAPITWSVANGVLRIEAGSTAQPWYLDGACYTNGCNQGGYLTLEITWAFSASHPFRNGQRVDFAYTVTGANMDPNGWYPTGAVLNESMTMQVPGEKRLVLGPTCDASNRTGLVTRYRNSGGIPLTNVVVDVPVPNANDGSGTEVSPKLYAATANIGEVLCSSDGNTFGATCDASTTVVRVNVGNLDPYANGELVMTFASDVTFPLGAIVRHRATMTSAELLPIAAPPGPPARWNRCPGTLALSAWFDADADGTLDAGEAGLAGWSITFTEVNPPNGAALVFAIDVTNDGASELEIPPGEYDIVVTPLSPADDLATWSYLSAVPTSLTITTGNTTSLSVPVNCACDDDDSCTTDSCAVGGYCGHVLNPEIAGCVAECGNGIVERGEACDTGMIDTWDSGCGQCKCEQGYEPNAENGLCKPVCGDGYTVGNEECDDGGESDYCTADCRNKCGNGQIDSDEQCDTGKDVDLVNGCLNCECSFAGWYFDEAAGTCAPRCGDHLVMGNEGCDDGNAMDGDGCSSACQVEDGWACERPTLTGCLPEEFCGEDRPSWCTIADPRNPGAAPTDWCGFLFGGGEDGEEFCQIGDLQCESYDGEACGDSGQKAADDDGELCLFRSYFCDFCGTMGTSVCVELCLPTAEVCNGNDDNCDGYPDIDIATGSNSVCRPLDTEIVTHPPLVTALSDATFTYQNPVDLANESFQCRLDAGEWFSCNGGELNLTDLANGQHVLVVRATRGDGAVDETPALYSWTIDPTVPDTFITSGPDDPTGSATATFTFDASVDNVEIYYCAMTIGTAEPTETDWTTCDATATYQDLEDGEHTLWVYVVTEAGVADPTPASWTFTVDTAQPETVITSHPERHTTSSEATLTYEDPDDASIDTFMCRLDAGEWYACDGGTTTFQDLADGVHVFEVYAVNAIGAVDGSPATWSWTIDNLPPETTITSGPSDPSQTGDGTFTFASNEVDVVYYCAIVAGDATPAATDYALCDATHGFEGLDNGEWTMWVYAVDPAGNADLTPATWTWTIDDSAPETSITSGPETPVTTGTDVVFTYTSPGATTTMDYECRVDGGQWYDCDGGTTTVEGDGLADGEHVFEVRACDPIREVCDPTPASWTWTVTDAMCPNDETGPTLECSDGVVVECVGGTAEVDVKAFTAKATDNCLPVSVEASVPDRFVLGDNNVVFTAEDGVGNTSSCAVPVTVSDTKEPMVDCPSDMVLPLAPNVCGGLMPPGQQPLANDACWGNAVTYASNAPAVFPVGTTAVNATWTDGSGNVATCRYNVTVLPGTNLDAQCPRDAYVAQGSGCAGGDNAGALLMALAGLLSLAALRLRRQQG